MSTAKKYFNSLNYTIGNEDAALEMEILPENSNHVFAVAGCGSRIIPLLAKNPHFITCVDISMYQLSLAELRVASLKELNYENFLSFWGYPSKLMSVNERKIVFKKLILSNKTHQIIKLLFIKNNWEPLLYFGKWEKTFKKLSKINSKIVGKNGLGIFDCQSKEEQKNYWIKKFPQKAWSFSIFLLANSVVFNTLLYKGNFPKKNIKESMHSFYTKRFKHLFSQDIARKNYFLQLLFFEKLQFAEGLPIECNKEVFLKAKKSLRNAKIKFVLGDVINEIKQIKHPINFLSLSDIPSYFKPPQEQNFLQDVKKFLAPKGLIVNRYYLRIPENLNTDGYKNITSNYKKNIANEKVQMYSFGIYQKNKK